MENKYHITHLIELLNAKPLFLNYLEHVNELCIDSRRVRLPANTLFFAIQTKSNNGHKYLKHAYQAGVRMFLVDDAFFVDQFLADCSVLLVKDVLHALQRLSFYHRKQFQIPVLAITGSNGKTTVKEWLAQILAYDFQLCKNPRSYNSQIGVPISVWQLNDSHQRAIFEAGISRIGEMLLLETIIQPTEGIFLNIGEAHAEGFSSIKNKVYEKMLLFSKVNTLFYSLDYQEISDEAANLSVINPTVCLISWSLNGLTNANLRILSQQEHPTGILLTGKWKKERLELIIPFKDKASIENVVAIWCYLLHLGIPHHVIVQRIAHLHTLENRLAVKLGKNYTTIINDSYSFDLKSLEVALSFMAQQKKHPKFTIILSDIPEIEHEKELGYQKLIKLIKSFSITKFILVGPEMKRQKSLFKGLKATFYESTEQLLKNLKKTQFFNETILLKGARAFKFEQLEQALVAQQHDTALYVNLDAFAHNLQVLKTTLNPQVKTMAMVKAMAYGSGITEMASQLQYQGVDYLAVAYTDEGVSLREAGINLPIMVMSPHPDSLPILFENKLEPEVYSIQQLNHLLHWVNSLTELSLLPIHLKLNTGMNRLGLDKHELPQALELIKTAKRIEVRSVFSHLAASGELPHQDFTLQQFKQFEKMCQTIIDALGYCPMRHMLNSSGILTYPDKQYEMVRMGVGLYGINPTQSNNFALKQVSTLKTIIRQIRKVKAGESVGYSRACILNKDSEIATIAIGYADGVSRACGNGKVSFWVNGQFAPTVGHICMDMCMIDVSNIKAKEGDEVEIFGPNNPVAKLAASTGQSVYEWLTAVSHRVKRIHIKEDF